VNVKVSFQEINSSSAVDKMSLLSPSDRLNEKAVALIPDSCVQRQLDKS